MFLRITLDFPNVLADIEDKQIINYKRFQISNNKIKNIPVFSIYHANFKVAISIDIPYITIQMTSFGKFLEVH